MMLQLKIILLSADVTHERRLAPHDDNHLSSIIMVGLVRSYSYMSHVI